MDAVGKSVQKGVMNSSESRVKNEDPVLVATVTLNPAIDRTVVLANLRPGAVNRAESAGDRAGGKGVNVAAALAEQGHRVAALGFLGRDNAGVFTEFLVASGVEDRFVRVAGATRTGIKIVDTTAGETTDLNFPGLAPTRSELAELGARLDGIEAGWCVLAGSLPPGVAAGFYAEAITRLKARGVRVALDTSGAALREALSAGPDVIKPNVHELAELAGRELRSEDEVIAAARALIRGGVGLVAVSRGAEGACFVSEDEVVSARPPSIPVRSTVGAGDAMVAGIVAGRLRGLDLAGCARLATAFSLHALTRQISTGVIQLSGADRGDLLTISPRCSAGQLNDPRLRKDARAAVEAFAARVEVKRLSGV